MAGLTGAYDAKRKDGAIIAFAVAAGVRVFKGALVSVNSATGLVGPATDAAGTVFVGVAYESADNSGGAGGAVLVRVQTSGLVRLRHLRQNTLQPGYYSTGICSNPDAFFLACSPRRS